MVMPLACLLSSAAQQAAQFKEEAGMATNNLEDCQRKLQSCILSEKQKADTIQELQRELQKLQKDSLTAEEELTPNRYHRFTSRDSLSSCEPVRTLWAAAQDRDSKPREASSQAPNADTEVHPPVVAIWL